MAFVGFYNADLFDCPAFQLFTAGDCPRAIDILERKSFEPGSMALWCRYARTATSILDIGSQVGIFALAAAQLRSDITIHAFEPNPDAFARLQVHVRLNGLKNITPHRCALNSVNGVTQLSWVEKGHISSGARLGVPAANDELFTTVYVACKTLDSMGIGATLGPRGLVKIDVEGGEAVVLEGMAQALQNRPDIILETFSQANCDRMNAQLEPMGYRVYKVIEATGELIPQDRLMPAKTRGEDFNQFLTVRDLRI